MIDEIILINHIERELMSCTRRKKKTFTKCNHCLLYTKRSSSCT